MSSSIIHDDIKKIEKLLVNAVHLVKSPASRKTFFLMKGQGKTMTKDELKGKLKDQGLSEDEIKYTLENESICNILLNNNNNKNALDVIKDGIRETIDKITKTLESNSISEFTSSLVEPLEQLTSFLSITNDSNNDNDVDKDKDKDKDEDNSDKDFENSVSELANEISGLANDTVELVENVIN